MYRSVGRFLTTHVGSLPRPDHLMRIMFAKEEGVPVEPRALEDAIGAATDDIVRQQVAARIDIVNDGEMSKPSYATYVKDRLTGFGGEGNSYVFQDLVDFPELANRIFADAGRSRRKTPACNGPIASRGDAEVKRDVTNLQAAAAAAKADKMFMTAASPGVVSLFFRNEHYKTFEDYLFAIADAMRPEYEAICRAGLVLQIDCPDLAMGRHVQYRELTLDEFRKRISLHIEALNHAVAGIPAEQIRMHVCWGNYGGPHHHDVPLASIIDVLWRAKPMAMSFEAANPRHAHEWELFETVKPPAGKVLIPGLIECQSNYIEHPDLIAQRLSRYASLVGPENVIGGADCGYSIHVGSLGVDRRVVWAKLAALAEGAERASKRFWG